VARALRGHQLVACDADRLIPVVEKGQFSGPPAPVGGLDPLHIVRPGRTPARDQAIVKIITHAGTLLKAPATR
jgi:hypothetical protein